jgi:hypothetical protein
MIFIVTGRWSIHQAALGHSASEDGRTALFGPERASDLGLKSDADVSSRTLG